MCAEWQMIMRCEKVSSDTNVWRHVVTRCTYLLRQPHWSAAKLLITVRAVTLWYSFTHLVLPFQKHEQNPALVCLRSGSLQCGLPDNNQNFLKNMANTSNPCCSFHDLLVSRFMYLGVLPESEGIPHSFKIKLTRGKICPFLQSGAEQVWPCVGAAATLTLTSLQAEPKHPGDSTLHISPL